MVGRFQSKSQLPLRSIYSTKKKQTLRNATTSWDCKRVNITSKYIEGGCGNVRGEVDTRIDRTDGKITEHREYDLNGTHHEMYFYGTCKKPLPKDNVF